MCLDSLPVLGVLYCMYLIKVDEPSRPTLSIEFSAELQAPNLVDILAKRFFLSLSTFFLSPNPLSSLPGPPHVERNQKENCHHIV